MNAVSSGRPVLRLVPITDPAVTVTGPGWRQDAACLGLDTELFFPVDDRAASVEPPRRVCRGCPVRATCLADVLATEDPARRFGIRRHHPGRAPDHAPRRTHHHHGPRQHDPGRRG